jgi:hypothetical protein
MRKHPLPYLLFVFALVAVARAAPLPAEQRAASIHYLLSLRNADGGFRPAAAPGDSQLSAAVPVLRGLKYLGGRLPGRSRTVQYVRSCYDPAAGAFADRPGGTPDVRSSAFGLMSLVELGEPLTAVAGPVTAYFAKNATSVADIYIAEAALAAAEIKPPRPSDWQAAFDATRNADGTYGKSVADTARAVVTTLRMGEPVAERARMVRILREAQRPDGGFAAMGDASDLSTTYPVTRAFFMLMERPDLDRLRAFVARCRNADGGYGAMPGQPSNASATYDASIILHWADELAPK